MWVCVFEPLPRVHPDKLRKNIAHWHFRCMKLLCLFFVCLFFVCVKSWRLPQLYVFFFYCKWFSFCPACHSDRIFLSCKNHSIHLSKCVFRSADLICFYNCPIISVSFYHSHLSHRERKHLPSLFFKQVYLIHSHPNRISTQMYFHPAFISSDLHFCKPHIHSFCSVLVCIYICNKTSDSCHRMLPAFILLLLYIFICRL